MRPGDGQLSLFEVGAIDLPQSMSAPAAVRASTDVDEATHAARPGRTASTRSQAHSPRRPPRAQPGANPEDTRAKERVPARDPRGRSPGNASLLSPEDVARRYGLSRKAVYRAVARGELRAAKVLSRLRIELRAAKVLSRLRIDPRDLEAWLRANIVDARSPVPAPLAPGLPPSTGLRRLLQEP